jgi:hypothetical protein
VTGVPGSGPGRGTPWWRFPILTSIRPTYGPEEPIGAKRPGKLVERKSKPGPKS